MPNPSPVSLQNQAKITLQIDSNIFSGFPGLTVNVGIDRCCNTFAFTAPNDGAFSVDPFELPNVKVLLDVPGEAAQTVITGYIEPSGYGKDANKSTINLEGRSASGPLNDYSAGPPFQFEGLTFNQFSTEQYKNLDASANVGAAFATPDTQPINEIAFDIGKTAYDVFTELAGAQGLFPVPTADGRLEYKKFTGSGSFATLEDGKGVVRSISTNFDPTKRFQEYTVFGIYNGQQAEATVQDFQSFGLAKRGRKIVELKQEATDIVAAAKSLRQTAILDSFGCTAQVDGWHYKGKLWAPGEIITLSAPEERIKAGSLLMLREAAFQIDTAGGQSTTLNFCLPEAYTGKDMGVLPWDF